MPIYRLPPEILVVFKERMRSPDLEESRDDVTQENGQKIGGPPGRGGRPPNAASFVNHIFQYAHSSFLAFGGLALPPNGILASASALRGTGINSGTESKIPARRCRELFHREETKGAKKVIKSIFPSRLARLRQTLLKKWFFLLVGRSPPRRTKTEDSFPKTFAYL